VRQQTGGNALAGEPENAGAQAAPKKKPRNKASRKPGTPKKKRAAGRKASRKPARASAAASPAPHNPALEVEAVVEEALASPDTRKTRRSPKSPAAPASVAESGDGDVAGAEDGGSVGFLAGLVRQAVAESLGAREDEPAQPVQDSGATVELSVEEALRLLDEMRGASSSVGGLPESRPACVPTGAGCEKDLLPPGEPRPSAPQRQRRLSSVMPSCRVLAFESPTVEPDMDVVKMTAAQLGRMIFRGDLDAELVPVCATLAAFVEEWDRTPLDVATVVLVNLRRSADFVPALARLRPETAEAYWVAFETLRGEVSTAKSEFLSAMRSRERARAIGYSRSNLMEAARRGSDIVLGRVEWGFFGRQARTA